MNHDEENKNTSGPKPELEARIVASVTGEASPFETAELDRLAAAQPEVAEFKRQIESAHALVTDATRPDPQPLRLSPDRRAKLLKAIGASAPAPAPKVVPMSSGRRKIWRAQHWLVSAAACAALGTFTLIQTGLLPLDRKPARPDPSTTILGPSSAESPAPPAPGGLFSLASRSTPSVEREAKDREAEVKRVLEFQGRNKAASDENGLVPLSMPMMPAPMLTRNAATKAEVDRSAAAVAALEQEKKRDPQTNLQSEPVASAGSNHASLTWSTGPVTLGTAAASTLSTDISATTKGLNLGGLTQATGQESNRFQFGALGGRTSGTSSAGGTLASPDTGNVNLPSNATTGDAFGPGTPRNSNITLGTGGTESTLNLRSVTFGDANGAIALNAINRDVIDTGLGGARLNTVKLKPEAEESAKLAAVSNTITAQNTYDFSVPVGGAILNANGARITTDTTGTGATEARLDIAGEVARRRALREPNAEREGVAQEAKPVSSPVSSTPFLDAPAEQRFGNSPPSLLAKNPGPAVLDANSLNLSGMTIGGGGSVVLSSTSRAGGDKQSGYIGFAPVGTSRSMVIDDSTSAITTTAGVPFQTLSQNADAKADAPVTIAGNLRSNGPVLTLANGNITVGGEQLNKQGLFLSALQEPDNFDFSAPGNAAKIETLGANTKAKTDPAPAARPAPPPPVILETATSTQPVSTFSLHVSDVSYRLAQAALARGTLPDAATLRPEEFYNAFNYGDPTPTPAEKVGCRTEQSAHPFLAQRNLARIALKVAATGRTAATPLRLTVLLDTSGSMEREDRVATIRRAMSVLVSLLGPNDRLTLIGFAREPRLLAENVAGDRGREILDILARIPADGGTNLEAALQLADQLAMRHRDAGAKNRIILLTDGAANLGNAEPAQLAVAIDQLRQRGIAFDACGVGLDGLDDGVLEALTRKGDGRYYVLNSPDDADAGFAQKLAGALRPAAENVKVQVRFNPARVATYRLIGFDQHRLREEDFRNGQVDAAELAAEEAGVALYQYEPLSQGEGDVGDVFVRFRDPATGEMIERSWPIAYDAGAPAFDRASPSLQLAGVSALLAEKLRGDAWAAQIRLRDLATVVSALPGRFPDNPRVQELVATFAQARRLTGE